MTSMMKVKGKRIITAETTLKLLAQIISNYFLFQVMIQQTKPSGLLALLQECAKKLSEGTCKKKSI